MGDGDAGDKGGGGGCKHFSREGVLMLGPGGVGGGIFGGGVRDSEEEEVVVEVVLVVGVPTVLPLDGRERMEVVEIPPDVLASDRVEAWMSRSAIPPLSPSRVGREDPGVLTSPLSLASSLLLRASQDRQKRVCW